MPTAPSRRKTSGAGAAGLSPELTEHLLGLGIERRLVEGIVRLVHEVVPERRDPVPEPLWTVRDVTSYLKVSPRTVETLIADGLLRPLWIRGTRRFTPEAVRAYLDRCARRER